ncbi:unnamed protein product [Pylaiella littoralis]
MEGGRPGSCVKLTSCQSCSHNGVMSGSGGRRGEPVRVYEGPAQQLFTCHMCKRQKNKGSDG